MFNNTNKIDLYLENFLINENDLLAKKQLRKLSEGEKREITKESINSLSKFTLNRLKNNDYSLIEETKGDINKLKELNGIKQTLVALRTLSPNNGNDIEELSTIENAIKNLETYKNDYMTGYKVNNIFIKSIYENIVTAIICSTSFLVATVIDYTKDITGKIVLSTKEIRSRKDHPTLYLKNLKNFNNKVVSGDLSNFFNASLKKNRSVGGTLGLSVLASLAIIPLLRELVYQYYYQRINISSYLSTQANFLLLNQKNLAIDSNSYRKQEEIAKKLMDLAEKIDVDQRSSSSRAEMNLRKENTSMSINEPEINNNFLL